MTHLAPSLRAQPRNPESSRGGILDCFAALAMTISRERAPHFALVPRTQRSALAVRCRAGAHLSARTVSAIWVPALRRNAYALQLVRDTRVSGDDAPCSVIASAAKQSGVFPRRDSGLLRCARNDDLERACATLRSRAPDAAQRPCGALQSRGHLSALYCVAFWVPALRSNAYALQRVRDTRVGRFAISVPGHAPQSQPRALIREQSFPILPQCKKQPADPSLLPVRPAVPGSST
jgi:hypothetical protein